MIYNTPRLCYSCFKEIWNSNHRCDNIGYSKNVYAPKDKIKNIRNILIGVANVILNDAGQILVSRRREAAKLGIGKLATPGGCLEENEKIVDCARREVLEETGLVIQPFEIDGGTVFHTVEYFHPEGIHNLTLYVASRVVGGELYNNEPTKHTDWTWVSLNQLETLSSPDDDWIPTQKLKLLRERGKI